VTNAVTAKCQTSHHAVVFVAPMMTLMTMFDNFACRESFRCYVIQIAIDWFAEIRASTKKLRHFSTTP